MQTFIPFVDNLRTVASLDRQRLGKQRLESLQILNTLTGKSTGWSHHPAVLMWAGHERALCFYAIATISEWNKRGYEDGVLPKIDVILADLRAANAPVARPCWWGDPRIHISHVSRLLQANRAHYLETFELTDAVADRVIGTSPELRWPGQCCNPSRIYEKESA